MIPRFWWRWRTSLAQFWERQALQAVWEALGRFASRGYSPRSLRMDHGSRMALYGSAAIEESLGVVVKREPLGASGRLRGALLWPSRLE